MVGCGKLNNIVADALLKNLLPGYDLVGVYSRTADKAVALAEKMTTNGHPCKVCSSIDELLELRPDYLVEAASPAAMRDLALKTLQQGTSILTLSIGALADDAFYSELQETAAAHHAHVYVVSGATGGFDVLQTVTLMGNAKAVFHNKKGPDALKGTPVYDETLQKEERTVFEGNATEAIAMFPTKVNVAVAASRASVGPKEMNVTIDSIPGFKGDTQYVEICNDEVNAAINVYSQTSAIAGWSVVSTLRNLNSPIVFC